MPTYQLQKLPTAVAESFSAAIAPPHIGEDTSENITLLQDFSQALIGENGTNLETNRGHDDWAVINFTLQEPWQGKYNRIRIFYNAIVTQGVLVLHGINGTIEKYALNSNRFKEVRAPTLFYKRLSRGSLFLYPASKWDNLSTYSESIKGFYQRLNSDLAHLVSQKIIEDESSHPVIIEPGCGTGENYSHWVQKTAFQNLVWDYVGIDCNGASINTAKNRYAQAKNAHFIQTSAVNFFHNPTVMQQYFDRDLYVLASGFMTEGVISFAHSMQIMRSLVRHENLKGFFISGLRASHVSAYLAKQMGLKRLDIDIPASKYSTVIEVYCWENRVNYISRLKEKMEKYGELDLSYVTDLSDILDAYTPYEIEHITHIYLLGILPTPCELKKLEQFITWNPHLTISCAAITEEEDDILKERIAETVHKEKFVIQERIQSVPLYSPHFFERLSASTTPSALK